MISLSTGTIKPFGRRIYGIPANFNSSDIDDRYEFHHFMAIRTAAMAMLRSADRLEAGASPKRQADILRDEAILMINDLQTQGIL